MFGVLFIHSFGSTNLEFQEFAEYLQEQGFQTSNPLLPGHGTSPDDLDRHKFSDWIHASEKALSELNCQGIFLVGQTTGASLALSLAAVHPELLGIITLSGIINLSKKQKNFARILHLKARLNIRGSIDSVLPVTHNQQIRQKVKFYKQISKISLIEALAMIHHARKHLHQVNQPIYIFHSKAAEDFGSKNAYCIFNGVSSEKKKIKFIEKGSAVMSVDEARHIVFQECASFFWSCVDLYQM